MAASLLSLALSHVPLQDSATRSTIKMRQRITRSDWLTASAAPPGNGRRLQPHRLSSRLRLSPAPMSSASQFTRHKRRRRNRRNLCHCLPSPNSGSTHTWRLRTASW
jgi:hypothetical protein